MGSLKYQDLTNYFDNFSLNTLIRNHKQMRTHVSRYIGSLLSLSLFQKERKAMVYVIKQLLSIMISIPTTLSDDREEFNGYKPS